jgi:lysyl-tRNA synthetase class 2
MSTHDSQTPLEVLRNARLAKLARLRELGLDPFPSRAERTVYGRAVLADYEGFEGKPVTVAGRLISWRKQGAMAFGHVLDQSGPIQLVLRRQTLAPTEAAANLLGYEDLKLLDIGDFLEAHGVVGKTQRGEISVMVESLRFLAKSLRPLPEKWSGLKDRELVLRKRYLDAIGSPDCRERFTAISRMLFATRQFLTDRGFLEFHTPVLQPQYGGGTAKPFRTYVNALGVEMYLSISHELYLKRLIAAGFDNVFTIGRYFRNEGIDRSHHPEFSMIETMTAYENYEYNMELIESLFRHIARTAFGRTVFQVGPHAIDFEPAWRRISMADAVLESTGVDFRRMGSLDEARTALAGLGVVEEQETTGHCLVAAFEAKVEDSLIQPTLVYGHPMEISPLAKPMAEDPRFAERFEIFIAGMECGDNWSEQNDPLQLYERWRSMYQMDSTEGEFQPLDYDFLEVLEHGMPPTTGIGPGIERMAMIFTEQADIYDVIFFPMMKPVISTVNQAIYGVETGPKTGPGAPVATVAQPPDMVLGLDDFLALVREWRIEPQSRTITLTPVASVVQDERPGAGAAVVGHVVIDGLLPQRRIQVAVYQAVRAERPGRGEAERWLVDRAEETLLAPLRELWPDFEFRWA